jgi:RimJ/RimL family protein N-acetyltransferase
MFEALKTGIAAAMLVSIAVPAAAAVIDYGFRTLGLETIRAYTDPDNAASQKVLLRCGLQNVGEIKLLKPTHHGERRAPLFRISRPAPRK